MYKRVSVNGRRRGNKRRKRKGWIQQCVIPVMAGILGIFFILAMRAVAAPEEPAVEEMAEELIELENILIEEPSLYEEIKKTPGVPVVVIDPGHGGMDTGCLRDGVEEKDINLQIGLMLKSNLMDKGYQVLMAREEDIYIAKEERVEMANYYEADIYISIHQNAYEGMDANGIETWYYEGDISRDSKRLAELVHRETVKSTGAFKRELRSDSEFHVNNATDMASCLIETGFISNEEECEKLVSAEYQKQIAAGIAEGIELYFYPKTMYLTFDDGPSIENTSAVLDILKVKDIKATFFVIGESVRKNPEVAKRIVEEGHVIGIHCNRHEYGDIYQSVESYIQDFEEAYNIVREITGVEARLFRFPGGSINAYNKDVREGIIEEMSARGYIYFDWNASLEDSVKKSEPEQLLVNARESTLGRKKVILLAHDVVYHTVLCLEELIDQFPEYKMEVLTPEVEPIQF